MLDGNLKKLTGNLGKENSAIVIASTRIGSRNSRKLSNNSETKLGISTKFCMNIALNKMHNRSNSWISIFCTFRVMTWNVRGREIWVKGVGSLSDWDRFPHCGVLCGGWSPHCGSMVQGRFPHRGNRIIFFPAVRETTQLWCPAVRDSILIHSRTTGIYHISSPHL